MRESLGIAPEDLVIGHTGRFVTPKNHGFLAEIVAEAARRRPVYEFCWLAMARTVRHGSTRGGLGAGFAHHLRGCPADVPASSGDGRVSLPFALGRTAAHCPRSPGSRTALRDFGRHLGRDRCCARADDAAVRLRRGAAHWASEVLAAARRRTAVPRRYPQSKTAASIFFTRWNNFMPSIALDPRFRFPWRDGYGSVAVAGKTILSIQSGGFDSWPASACSSVAARSGAHALSHVCRRIGPFRLDSRELVLAPPHVVRTLSAFHLFGRTL